MTIENSVLYNLYQAVKVRPAGFYNYGLYVEGFSGGVTIYAKGKALYRQTIYGDNKDRYYSYIDDWKKKDGKIYADNPRYISEMDGNKAAQKICGFRKIFETERFNAFSVNAAEFRKAVGGVDVINKREETHTIVISAHGGLLDIASWPDGIESAVWQIESKISASGAVMVDRKHLDSIRGKGTIDFACLKNNDKLGLYAKGGGIEAVFPVMDIDPARFLEVLEYEYRKPEPEQARGTKPEKKEPRERPRRKIRYPAKSTQIIPVEWGWYL